MIKTVDNYLNSITMYRLIMYYLFAIIFGAIILSTFGIIRYSIFSIVLSAFFLIIISWSANILFSKIFNAPTNFESVYISALILVLIISPATTVGGYLFLGWAAIFTMASKYILNIGKKHLFNPVAIAIFITAIFFNKSASWWIGTLYMLPFVLVGGLLIVRKIRRFKLVFSFLAIALLSIISIGFFQNKNITSLLMRALFDSPLLFFAFVMLTEPLTTPPTTKFQIVYAALVAFLFNPQIHLGPIFSTPELSLVIGNIFSYLVSPKTKLLLTLTKKIKTSPDTYDFVFSPSPKILYLPGQYMEWTLEHSSPDNRGNRRYFTLASSPTEDTLKIGVKFYPSSSTYKNALINLSDNTPIVAAQMAGDFILPNDPAKKLVFIAGGIGITPFRSMIKFLVDKKEKRDIVLFYANKTVDEIIYKQVFDFASEFGLKTVYALSDIQNLPVNWTGYAGRISQEIIQKEVPDYLDRYFYLSGPHAMVTAYVDILKKLGVSSSKIKTDFFPGFT